MTKVEIIEELHGYGEMWANSSYTKEYLENYLTEYKKSTTMSLEELYAAINTKK